MSMIWWGRVTSRSLRRWTARARQVWRRTVTGVLGGTAVVLVVIGARDHVAHTQHLLMATALCFAVAAAGWPVWRAPEHGLPDALRLRIRSRRIGWRVASVSGLGAALGLVVHLGSHGTLAHDAGVAAVWAVAIAPVPVVVESTLWSFAPRELRRRVRSGLLAEAVMELNTDVPQLSPLVLDPARGWAGTPVPRQSLPPTGRPKAPYEVRPTEERARTMAGGQALDAAQRVWLREAALRWDGSTLTLRDGRGTVVPVPLRPAPTALQASNPWSELPIELVLLREQGAGRYGWQARLLLIDASGRRLLTMPGLGLVDQHVARLASACGLVFTAQRWAEAERGFPWRRPLLARVYPRDRGHIHLHLSRWM